MCHALICCPFSVYKSGGRIMTLKDYVLTYKNDDGIVANLFDYYDKYIVKLDSRFSRYSYYKSKLVLCYFKDHEDVNPSMGYVWHKSLKGVRVCHCFGCGKTADVIRIHQILEKQYHNRELNEDAAAREVAVLFDIPLNEVEIAEDDYHAKERQKVQRIETLSNRYSKRDFADALRLIRKTGNLEALTIESIKMTAISKHLI